jgi:hypothetical protein
MKAKAAADIDALREERGGKSLVRVAGRPTRICAVFLSGSPSAVVWSTPKPRCGIELY